MAADEHDPDLDPRLARRLAALHPDVEDDGFTASLMAALPERSAAPVTTRNARTPPAWLFALAAAFAAVVLSATVGTGGDTMTPELLTQLESTSASAQTLGSMLGELPALFETHLYTLVAAALCAATLLAPQLLED